MPWLKLETANDAREYELGIVYYSGQLKNMSLSKVNEITVQPYIYNVRQDVETPLCGDPANVGQGHRMTR
jgi:hypothetical protein